MEFDLWDELMAIESRIDDLLRAFLGSRGRNRFSALPTGLRQPFLPATGVFGSDGDLTVRLELPGVAPAKDVAVTVEQGDLVVRGEHKRKEEVKEEDFYRMEASYGAFERRIPLAAGVQDEDIKAEYRDGVLKILVCGAHGLGAREAEGQDHPDHGRQGGQGGLRTREGGANDRQGWRAYRRGV
jgi:HSP20 family molecular chaperone IbpA